MEDGWSEGALNEEPANLVWPINDFGDSRREGKGCDVGVGWSSVEEIADGHEGGWV